MSEARSRAKASQPAGLREMRARATVADEETTPVKTDHEILAVALRDIDLINSALSTEAPVEKLKSGSNVMAAYRDFMRKGRKERDIQRSWEDTPNDKLFDRGIRNFSRAVQIYSSWSMQNPTLAKALWCCKDFRLSQNIDIDPIVFGAKKLKGQRPHHRPRAGMNREREPKEGAAVADEETTPSNAVKTDHEILAVALRDIDLINSALSTEAPVEKLKSGSNVMAAYRDFMRKGREERDIRRSWEDNPDDKLFDRGIHNFSRVVQFYSTWSVENPRLAKDFVLSQYIDAHPKRFGARKPGEEPLHQVPQQAT